MRRTFLLLCGLLGAVPIRADTAEPKDPPHYTYTVVHTYPHDTKAFTEGLIYLDGDLYESTGLYGQSSLRKVSLDSGKPEKQVKLDERYFGEGMTVIGQTVYQLTWTNQVGFTYDLKSFKKTGEFHFTGEGWGLTTDGTSLIMSDGTNEIRFINPKDFSVTRTIKVFIHGAPLTQINELEWVKGELYANIWQTESIVRIDPGSGELLGVIDLYGLLKPEDHAQGTDVLNGIAYDARNDRLFVTGKNWPKLFEITLAPATP